jgi:hypothetical protein
VPRINSRKLIMRGKSYRGQAENRGQLAPKTGVNSPLKQKKPPSLEAFLLEFQSKKGPAWSLNLIGFEFR